MSAQIVVFSRKTDAQRKKNFAFRSAKIAQKFCEWKPYKNPEAEAQNSSARAAHALPLFCNSTKQPLNLEKTTSRDLSVLLLIYELEP